MTAHDRPSERIHLSPPDMTARERDALLAAFDSNWIAPAGPALAEFEARIAAVTGAEAAVALNSGTAALHLACRVLGLGPGDIVIVPTATFVASANAVRYVGAVPHFVDCEPGTSNMDPELLERALSDLRDAGVPARAVMTVDLYGSCANYSEIEPICAAHDVPLIEDAAEAIGATHNGRPAGSFGTVAAISFNGNKLVTTGGGGALVGPAELVDRARHLAGQARTAAIHFEHDDVGYAYRLSNLSAAIGNAQLDRLDLLVARTRAVHRRYVDALGHLPGVELLSHDQNGRGNGWLSVMTTDPGLHPSPAQICMALLDENIEARPAWKPMHRQAPYREFGATGGSAADRLFETAVCLPSGSAMTFDQQRRVIDAVARILGPQRLDVATIDLSEGAAPRSGEVDLDVRSEQSPQHQDSPEPSPRAA